MKSFNHRFPWQVLVLIALLLAGCGESISSKSAGNSLSHHGSTPTSSMITEFVIPTLGSHPQDMVVGPDALPHQNLPLSVPLHLSLPDFQRRCHEDTSVPMTSGSTTHSRAILLTKGRGS